MKPKLKRRKPAKKAGVLVSKPAPDVVLRAAGPVTTPAPSNPRSNGRRRIPFTKELGDLVCERMAIDGHSLREISRDPDMPCAGTILNWVATIPSFAEQYTHARARLLEHWAEDIIDISDNPQEGEKVEISSQFGTKTTRGDMTEHRNMRINNRKWLLSKLAARKYGDKIDLNVGGQKDAPPLQSIVTVTTDPIQAAKLYQEAMRGITRNNDEQKALPSLDSDLHHEHDEETSQVCHTCNVAFCAQCDCDCAKRNSR
jgi:hypothetical protein